MTFEKLVHAEINPTNLARIFADQALGKLDEARARAFSIGGQIGRSKRADLADTGEPGVRFDDDHGRIERRKRKRGPAIGTVFEGQVYLVERNLRDLQDGASVPFAY